MYRIQHLMTTSEQGVPGEVSPKADYVAFEDPFFRHVLNVCKRARSPVVF